MIRVRVAWQGLTGAPWVSTHYFAGDGSGGEAAAAVAAVAAFWGSIDANIVNTVDWETEIEVAVMDDDGTRTGTIFTSPASGTGGASSNPVARATQVVVQWRTGTFVGGRELRGRTFVPALQDSVITNEGDLSTAVRASMITAAQTLAAVTSPALVVWSRTHQTTVAVDGASVWNEFGVLRSRRD